MNSKRKLGVSELRVGILVRHDVHERVVRSLLIGHQSPVGDVRHPMLRKKLHRMVAESREQPDPSSPLRHPFNLNRFRLDRESLMGNGLNRQFCKFPSREAAGNFGSGSSLRQ